MTPFTILITIILKLHETMSSIAILDKGMIPIEPESIGITFFITVENVDSIKACDVQVNPKKCCHIISGKEDCGTMAGYGVDGTSIEPKDLETLIIVYPTLIKYNHYGYCNFLLKYNCRNKEHKSKTIHISFSTNITEPNNHMFRKKISCKTEDQDPYNDCSPINCDEKYLGFRPFYGTANKCTAAPICKRDFAKELPDIVYVPNSNTCRDLDNPVTVGDVYSISTGLGVVTERQKTDGITVQLKSNLSTISQNMQFLKDLMYGKLCSTGSVSINYSEPCKSAIWAILACIFGLVALLFSFVCCINTSVWIYNKWSHGDLRECCSKVKKTIFLQRFKCEAKPSKVNKSVKNKLLRDVIVTDLPIELRESAIDLCERMGKEVRWKKRYRADAVTSVLKKDVWTSSDSFTTDTDISRK